MLAGLTKITATKTMLYLSTRRVGDGSSGINTTSNRQDRARDVGTFD